MARDKQMNVLLTAETVDGLRAETARSDVSLSEVAHGRMEGRARTQDCDEAGGPQP
ncbi:hypothetical protein [Collinsella tanakaei]|uniref:hypothetical protein n=1 Tax=Collinsella tanakaei TaxID=626935 RepID=UPI0026EA4DF4|nr:hypothetical protein [Collinsella tanakaei]